MNSISIKVIMDRILRNEVLSDLSLEAVIDWTVDFMDITGVPSMYTTKTFNGAIENYRVKLPCDFMQENQLLIKRNTDGHNEQWLTPRYATSTFTDYRCNGLKPLPHEITYTINRDYIHTSIENGLAKMEYLAIQTDEHGYPMLPDQRAFLNALEWYVKYKYFTILWDSGKIEDKRLENAKQEYAFAVGQCQNQMRRMSLARAESFMNSLKSLIPRDNEFKKRFSNLGERELVRIH